MLNEQLPEPLNSFMRGTSVQQLNQQLDTKDWEMYACLKVQAKLIGIYDEFIKHKYRAHSKRLSKAVGKYNQEGELLETFKSARHLSNILNLPESLVYYRIRNGLFIDGYIYKYLSKNTN